MLAFVDVHGFTFLPTFRRKFCVSLQGCIFTTTASSPDASILDSAHEDMVPTVVGFDREKSTKLLPVLHDLQFELMFRLRPVSSQSSLLESILPGVIQCPHDGSLLLSGLSVKLY